jgi:UDP-N-acetylmuramoylalanine--D-glutamate ligase
VTTLVLGAAVSGTAAAKLADRLGHSVRVYDDRPEALSTVERHGLATVAGPWDDGFLAGVSLAVASPGIPEHAAPLRAVRAAGITLWSEMEFAARHLGVPYVAVTGTNGKTTVVEAATRMLEGAGRKAAAAGNIGTALSDLVGDRWEIVVVEASSFQLRFAPAFHPEAAAVTNVAPDHLDWHGTMAAYRRAKAQIFANLTADQLVAYDVDDAGARELVADGPGRRLPVSATHLPVGGYGVVDERLIVDGDALPVADLGAAFVVDLALAAALARAGGAGLEAVAQVVAGFVPGPHRRSVVGTWRGVTWVDDSKATNPHAAAAAAASYASVVLIAGGRNKGLDLAPLVAVPAVTHVVAIGEAAADLAAMVDPDRFTAARDMTEAVAAASAVAEAGDVVLLAPGCASFDMFASYARRGEAFAAAVRAQEGSG